VPGGATKFFPGAYTSKFAVFVDDVNDILELLKTAHLFSLERAPPVVFVNAKVYLAHPKAGVYEPNA
jgi:hypothetical protein